MRQAMRESESLPGDSRRYKETHLCCAWGTEEVYQRKKRRKIPPFVPGYPSFPSFSVALHSTQSWREAGREGVTGGQLRMQSPPH